MFKVVYKNIVIDTIEKPIYCRYIPTSGMKLRTDETSANCIISSNGEETYHLTGRSPLMPETFKSVELIPVDKLEYDYLKSLTTDGDSIQFDINKLKADKIAEVSAASEAAIHAGTDIVLSNGKTYHFSFSDQDQFQIGFLHSAAKNAVMLESMGLDANETGMDYPWHADGRDCEFYSREDVLTIGDAMRLYIAHNNSYFHALRNYIDSLTNPLAIADLYYGIEVPKMYWGEVYSYTSSKIDK